MSDQTKTALIQALTHHITDETDSGVIITGLVLCASLAEVEETAASYWFDVQDDQPAHHTRGLVELLNDWAKRGTQMDTDD